MINYLIVSIGAAIGGVSRYWLSNLAYKYFPAIFPYGTLIVNIVGSFLLGLIIFVFDEKELLKFGFNWLKFSLFGEKTMKVKNEVLSTKKKELEKKFAAEAQKAINTQG